MRNIYILLLFSVNLFAYAQCVDKAIPKSTWSILSFDTEEISGEGADNGRAAHAIDSKLNTYWHTKWKDYTSTYPHFIAVDMGQSYPINGISIVSRDNNKLNKPKNYELYLSQDGTNWGVVQSVGDFSYPNINATGQTASISFGAVQARYFKIEILSNYNDDPHIAIAEIMATEISGEGCEATGQNNQILTFDEVPKKYTTDEPFTLNAEVNTNLPIYFEIVSGPAAVSGNTVTLTGEGGTVKIKASQAGNSNYYSTEIIRTFEVVDLSQIVPDIKSRITNSYPLEMTSLSPYLLTASATIDESETLSVSGIKFFANGTELETKKVGEHYEAWWEPATYGSHNIKIIATASNNQESNKTITIDVVNNVSDRDVSTLTNAVIDWGTMGTQWYYGSYTLPQFVGSYNKIMANFKVTCPDVPGGCDDWDRIGYVQIKDPNGDWIELFRYITPYGVPCNHEIDVTDYASVLQGKIDFRVYIETWGTGGWKMDLNLLYNKGEPEFKYSTIEEIWHGTYNFGDLSDLQPIPVKTISSPFRTESSKFRLVTTGHGWGQNNTSNAAEFYYAKHNLQVNGNNTFLQDLLTKCNPNPDNCTNQQGTWFYNRAGWCPGTIAKPYEYNTTPYIGNEYEFKYQFQTDYVDYCHPNNPDCVSGTTCPNCNDGYNPHYRISGYMIYKGNSPLGTLSTNEIKPLEVYQLSALPNPADGFFRLYLDNEMNDFTVQIFDANGKSFRVYSFENRDELVNYTFDISALPIGVYFIKIYNENQMANTKLLIK